MDVNPLVALSGTQINTLDVPTDTAIVFHDNLGEEVMRLDRGYMWYRGNRIDDVAQVYERFIEFLSGAGY